jgi:competence protein ComEA
LPPGVQGRIRLTGAHLAVVALFVLVGAVATAWWVSRADAGSQALPAAGPAPSPLVTAGAADPAGVVATTATAPASAPVSSGQASAGAPVASESPPAAIVVDVAGKVRKPGIAKLPAGSRVVDALHAAGGVRRGVSLAALNLARVLTDGEQIVVGVRAPPGVSASAAGAAAPTAGSTGSPVPMVNVNTAAQAELEELPGIGPVTARAILDYRTENGSFTAVDQLLEVSGIGDATLAKIAPYVTL